MIPEKGYIELRRGRWSLNHAQYLVSFCSRNRQRGLHETPVRTGFFDHLKALEKEGALELRTGVVMPDHMHLLLRLPAEADLSALMRRIKGPLSPLLRKHGLGWQEGFHDHRLRDPTEVLPVFRYVFLNPYRAQLVSLEAEWPGYFCCADDWSWFRTLSGEDHPDPGWLLGSGVCGV